MTYLMSGRFKKQIAYMETHPDVDCLGTWAIEIGNGVMNILKTNAGDE